MPESLFEGDDHALHTGLVLGEMVRRGINARPVVTMEGNYLPFIEVWLDDERMIMVRVCAPSERPVPPVAYLGSVSAFQASLSTQAVAADHALDDEVGTYEVDTAQGGDDE